MFEGVHYAMHSGVLAAEIAHDALTAGDCSNNVLRQYQTRLNKSYPKRNLKRFRRIPHLLTNPRLYQLYPGLAGHTAEAFFRANSEGHQKPGRFILRHLGVWGAVRLLVDGWRLLRAFFL